MSTTSSGTSASSSRKLSRSNRESPPLLPYNPYRSDPKRSSTTEAHPNALKNIKNFPLLMASLTETVNHIEENRMNRPASRRSMSTVDFRTIDIEKISKLFGLEDDQAVDIRFFLPPTHSISGVLHGYFLMFTLVNTSLVSCNQSKSSKES